MVVAVVALLLADPILCRVESAGPCAGTCQSRHTMSSPHPGPASHDHDASHGCICQGATNGVDARMPSVLNASGLDSSSTAGLLPRPFRLVERFRPAFNPLHTQPTGRAVRTRRQSFLF